MRKQVREWGVKPGDELGKCYCCCSLKADETVLACVCLCSSFRFTLPDAVGDYLRWSDSEWSQNCPLWSHKQPLWTDHGQEQTWSLSLEYRSQPRGFKCEHAVMAGNTESFIFHQNLFSIIGFCKRMTLIKRTIPLEIFVFNCLAQLNILQWKAFMKQHKNYVTNYYQLIKMVKQFIFCTMGLSPNEHLNLNMNINIGIFL